MPTKHTQQNPSTAIITARNAIAALIKLDIDLIPIKPGDKQPLHAAWNVPVKRALGEVLVSFARSKRAMEALDWDAEEFTMRIANIGVLNETSRIVTLDCDSPLAGRALQAACEALKGDFNLLYPETSWNSVKGQKAMYRRPVNMPASRTVFKVWKNEGSLYDVIFELRGTGQDVLPPSWRADAGQRLAWFHEHPTRIPPMPPWLVTLNAELVAGRGIGLSAMMEALNLTDEQRDRTTRTAHSMTHYPVAVAAAVAERAWTNAHHEVTDLLEIEGYVQEGKRWKPKNSSHNAGIVPPRQKDDLWLCEHESDVLAGLFDAWRIMVECEFAGDVAAAVAWARAEQMKAVKESSSQPVDQSKEKKKQPDGHETPPQEKQLRKTKPKASKLVQGDFFTRVSASIKPVVSGHLNLPPGCHLLSAMPKAGKSTLITALALTAATGQSLSGAQAQPGPVLYLAFDENVAQNLQPRMRRLIVRHKLDIDKLLANMEIFDSPDALPNWAFSVGCDCTSPLDIEMLDVPENATEVEIEGRLKLVRPKFTLYTRALYHYLMRHQVKFAVIDVVTSMRMSAPPGKSVYERDLEDFLAFNAIGTRTGCAIVAVHHMNKAAAGNLSANGVSHMAKVSGTNAIAGAVQSIISMSRPMDRSVEDDVLYEIEPRGKKVIIEQTSRDTMGLDASAFSLVALPIEGDDEPALEWIYMGPASDMLSRHEDREFILNYLYEQPEYDFVKVQEIHKAAIDAGVTMSTNREVFRKLPRRMVRTGQLESTRGAAGGGFRLTRQVRALIKARRDAAGY